ncbi:MAG TPA: TetR/AcrR family transcriptional regulator [Chloroflexota bacterium]
MYRAGSTPTVAQAAVQARVSRATAYRYFPTQEALLVELAVTPGVARVEQLLTALSTDDVEQRLLLLLDTFGPIVIADETQFRRALRVYLDTWLRSRRHPNAEIPAVREGRRMRWLDQVLGPLPGMSEAHRRRLQAALALTLGIDSVVIMKDVCGLDDDEALAVLRWAATVLLRVALAEPLSLPTPPSPGGNSAGAP